GGVFGPSVVIGGALGGAVGRIFHQIMPGIVTHPGAFVVVGMAGFFAGVSNAPISTIIFVSEMTNSYHLLLPGLLVCSLSYMLSRRWTIYEKQVPSKIDSNAHKGDFFVDILGTIRVRELTGQLRKVQLIPEDMSLKDFRKIFSSSDQQYFPVVDKDNKMTGIFSINDIRGVIFDDEVSELVRMKDVANADIIYTTPSEDLNEVFKKCTIRNLHRVPVVRDDDHSILIGMLDRREMIQFYNQRVREIKAGHEPETGPDRDVNQLRNITVREAMNPSPVVVPLDMKIDELRDLIYDRGFNSFPLVSAGNKLEGVLSLSDWKSAFKKGDDALTAGDIATRRVVSVTAEESLFSALAKITAGDFAILPVVKKDQPDALVGIISRTDIMSAFNRAVSKRAEA
ncbi:MAG: chloride channel protein, partial [Deltaproteobacteria bacterium]|nr:chloride channel protein [Deltaproteobacteria bacterium]